MKSDKLWKVCTLHRVMPIIKVRTVNTYLRHPDVGTFCEYYNYVIIFSLKRRIEHCLYDVLTLSAHVRSISEITKVSVLHCLIFFMFLMFLFIQKDPWACPFSFMLL